jgi:hypothetical protein
MIIDYPKPILLARISARASVCSTLHRLIPFRAFYGDDGIWVLFSGCLFFCRGSRRTFSLFISSELAYLEMHYLLLHTKFENERHR